MKQKLLAILVFTILGLTTYGFFYLTALYHNDLAEQYYEDDVMYDDMYTGYIVEEEVDGPEDCTDLEEYDVERGVCFFECDTIEQCDDIEARLYAILDGLDEEYKEFSKSFKEFEGDTSDIEKDAEIIYRIDDGEEFVVVSGTEDASHKKIKKWLADISPDNFSDDYIARLVLVSTMDDGAAAFVVPSEEDEVGTWDMVINMEIYEEEGDTKTLFTLVHEYAHILTLNKSQLSDVKYEAACLAYFLEEGCLQEDAYLNLFYERFWDERFDALSEDADENYDVDPSAFVSVYAATNPAEDIAESFASFIFSKRSDARTIADEKVAFFYEYPELLAMREDIRNVLKPVLRKRVLR